MTTTPLASGVAKALLTGVEPGQIWSASFPSQDQRRRRCGRLRTSRLWKVAGFVWGGRRPMSMVGDGELRRHPGKYNTEYL